MSIASAQLEKKEEIWGGKPSKENKKSKNET